MSKFRMGLVYGFIFLCAGSATSLSAVTQNSANVLGGLKIVQNFSTFSAHVSLELTFPQSNFSQTVSFQEYAEAPDKLAMQFDGGGLISFSGDKASIQMAGGTRQVLPLTQGIGPLLSTIQGLTFLNISQFIQPNQQVKYTTLANGDRVYTLTASSPDGAGWQEVDVDIQKGFLNEIRIFDAYSQLSRTITFSNYVTANGQSMPSDILVHNYIRGGPNGTDPLDSGYETIQHMTLGNIEFNQALNDSLFQ